MNDGGWCREEAARRLASIRALYGEPPPPAPMPPVVVPAPPASRVRRRVLPLMHVGAGVRLDCAHEIHCLTIFDRAHPTARAAHCPPGGCVHHTPPDRRGELDELGGGRSGPGF